MNEIQFQWWYMTGRVTRGGAAGLIRVGDDGRLGDQLANSPAADVIRVGRLDQVGAGDNAYEAGGRVEHRVALVGALAARHEEPALQLLRGE